MGRTSADETEGKVKIAGEGTWGFCDGVEARGKSETRMEVGTPWGVR